MIKYNVVGFIKINRKWKRLYFSYHSLEDAALTFNLKLTIYKRLFEKGKIENFELAY